MVDELAFHGQIVHFDDQTGDAVVRGARVRLTPRQVGLLRFLYAHRGATVSHAQIYEALWGPGYDADRHRTNVQNLVWHLRQRLEVDPKRPALVISQEGVGYRLNIRPPVASATVPPKLTQLIGREQDREATVALLQAGERLVTLVGPPGVGKTRLALQVAEDLRAASPMSVTWVALETIHEPAFVLGAIAQRLRVREAPGTTLLESLVDRLQHRPHLLVLDNFEQVVVAAPALGALLARCPVLQMLVTSRTPLALQGEREYAILPLELPMRSAGDAVPLDALVVVPSVALFIERAKAVKPGFELTDANARSVAEICARLDGLPLAIELAAARIRILEPAEILEHLQHRLELLRSASGALPQRHHSLRAAINWSYSLLNTAERRLFRRLAVFSGGCRLEAVQAVCGMTVQQVAETFEVLDVLEALTAKSLLRQEQTDSGSTRLMMLETVREYALERLSQEEAAEDVVVLYRCHATYYAGIAEEAKADSTSCRREVLAQHLDHEHANFRRALRWLLDHAEAELALRLCGAICWFWILRGHLREGRKWVQDALAVADGAPAAAQAVALEAAGALAMRQGDFREARSSFRACAAIRRELGIPLGLVTALNGLAEAAIHQDNLPEARHAVQEGLPIARSVGDRAGIARALSSLAMIEAADGDVTAARRLHEESLALWRELSDQEGLATALSALALLAKGQGDLPVARRCFEESLVLWRETGNPGAVVDSLNDLGYVALAQDDDEAARRCFEESLCTARRLEHRRGMRYAMTNLAFIARKHSEYAAARSIYTDLLALYHEQDSVEGLGTTFHSLGMVALAEGDVESAYEFIRQSLAMYQQIGRHTGTASILESFSGVLSAIGQSERAVRLAASAQRLVAADPIGRRLRPPADRARLDQLLEQAHHSLSSSKREGARTQGYAMSLEQAIADALECLPSIRRADLGHPGTDRLSTSSGGA